MATPPDPPSPLSKALGTLSQYSALLKELGYDDVSDFARIPDRVVVEKQPHGLEEAAALEPQVRPVADILAGAISAAGGSAAGRLKPKSNVRRRRLAATAVPGSMSSVRRTHQDYSKRSLSRHWSRYLVSRIWQDL